MKHLIRDGSDHAPLHVTCKTGLEAIVKPFRFLNFLTSHHSFDVEVRKAQEIPIEVSHFKILHEK